MRSRNALALVSVAACESFFPLNGPPPPPPVDAPTCIPIGVDTDLDGIDDACDVCPEVADADQRDVDRDGVGDACDNCPGLASSDQSDSDLDGVGDACDDCPMAFDIDQRDQDRDGAGDACDPCPADPDTHDEDGDGIIDCADNCPANVNVDQSNSDGDTLGDACDGEPTRLDCLLWFDGLATLDGWDLTASAGTWAVDGDSVAQSDPQFDHGYLVTKRSFADPLVITKGAVIALGTGTEHHVGVWPRTTPNANAVDQGLVVEAVDNGVAGQAFLFVSTCDAVPNCGALEPAPPATNVPVAAGLTVVAAMDLRFAPTWVASISVGAGSAVASRANIAPNVQGRIALRTFRTAVRFDFAVALSPPVNGACPPRLTIAP